MGEYIVRSGPPAEAFFPLAVRSKIEAALAVRSKMKRKEVLSVLSLALESDIPAAEWVKDLSLAVHSGLRAEVALYLAARSGLRNEDVEKVFYLAVRSGLKAEEAEKVVYLALYGGLKAEEILSLAVKSGLTAEERAKILWLAFRFRLYADVKEVLSLAARSGLMADVEEVLSLSFRSGLAVEEVAYVTKRVLKAQEVISLAVRSGIKAEVVLSFAVRVWRKTDLAMYLAVRSGIKADEVLSAAIRLGLKAEEEVYAVLLEQLLASFNRLQEDPDLDEWQRPPKPQYCVSERRTYPREDPKCPFFLFKMKASAKKGQVSWWQKKYPFFPQERADYMYALRVARLVIGTEGLHLEQAGGGGGQPGALSFQIYGTGSWWPHPNGGVFKESSSGPLKEVAVIKRLPRGDGISIMSYVCDLGVKLHDILFVLPCPSATVALSFSERSFYVSSKFTEEPLYTRAGLDFIDITAPVENLIKKLCQLYELEEQEKRIMHEKQDHQESQELMRQQEEQEQKKLEGLQRRRAERKKYKYLHKEMKEAVQRMKEGARAEKEQEQDGEYEETCFYAPILPLLEESDWVKPSGEELCQKVINISDLPSSGLGNPYEPCL